MNNIKALQISGLTIVLFGATLSLCFDGGTPNDAQFEKVGNLLFLIGAILIIRGGVLKKRQNDGVNAG